VAAIRRFIDAWNERCEPFTWTNTAQDTLDKLNTKNASATAH
jgi:hypothetical protein